MCAQMFGPSHSEDADQTGRRPRLICDFAGRAGHFVGFVMRWHIWYKVYYKTSSMSNNLFECLLLSRLSREILSGALSHDLL